MHKKYTVTGQKLAAETCIKIKTKHLSYLLYRFRAIKNNCQPIRWNFARSNLCSKSSEMLLKYERNYQTISYF